MNYYLMGPIPAETYGSDRTEIVPPKTVAQLLDEMEEIIERALKELKDVK